MTNKNLLYKFEGDDGINLEPPHEWNDITASVENLQKINFLDSSSKIKIIPQVKSIPTPYARMKLFANAFEDPTFPIDLKNHILQDILDVMEFVFLHKATSFDNKLDFVKIKLSEDKENSKLSSIHRKYINTLNTLSEKYNINSDEENQDYNCIDVFYVTHNSNNYQVIAGTSPFTVFFTPEKRINGIQGFFEWEKDVATGIEKRKMKEFGQRNKIFLNYLFDFKNLLPNSSKGFLKELEGLFKNLGEDFIKINTNDKTTSEVQCSENQDPKKIDIVPGLNYEIFNATLDIDSHYKLKPSITPITNDNGIFNAPLILTINNISKPYFNDIDFDKNNWEDIFKKAVSSSDRSTLPSTIVKYPWVSPIDDFLEPKLIKLPYKLNSKQMYDGNKDLNNFQYLIPLKEEYFKYFSAEDIERYFSFTIISCTDDKINSDQIEVRLRIPIEGDNNGIVVKKIYSNHMIDYGSYEQDMNSGQILKLGTFFALWPAIIHQGISRYYLINYEHLKKIDDMWKYPRYYFFDSLDNGILKEIKNDNEHNDVIKSVNRDASTRLTSLKYPPELIQLERKNGAKGFFLPQFKKGDEGTSNNKWYVAIDFGTSNSVIAFSNDKIKGVSTLLPINSINFVTFYYDKSNTDSGITAFNRAVDMFFIPNEFGQYSNNELIGTPFSTEVVYKTDEKILTHQILHSNITFKRVIPPKEGNNENGVKTNLKWSSNDEEGINKQLINLFFKQIKSIVEKQAIDLGISLDNIEYIYSYPLAFDEDQKANLKKIFTENNFNSIDPLDESQCSAKYFNQYVVSSFGVNNPTPAITIDIGGGTSDIVGYKDGITMFKNSLLFGGKDIFEDLSKSENLNNPFVFSLRKFLISLGKKEEIINFVFNETIFSQYKDSHSLFSYIVSKDEFKKAQLEIHNTDFYKYFRLSILYFYSSILYFLSLNIKKYYKDKKENINDISEIRIGIGGNGSRLLEWICRGEKWSTFIEKNDTYKKLMENIFIEGLGIDKNNNFELTIIQSDHPKEEVVKGLLINNPDADKISSKTENMLICCESLNINSDPINIFDDYRKINRKNYKNVQYSNFENSEINKFNQLFKKLLSTYKSKIDNDIKQIYINNFLGLFDQFTKDKVLSETRNVIENYFSNGKSDSDQEYINSYFITEAKACLDLIKKQLSVTHLKNNN